MRLTTTLLLLLLPAPLLAQRAAPEFTGKQVPAEEGFRVFIVPDMEGMGSTVNIREVIAGNEGERYRDLTSPDYWDRFRGLLTQEVNATIAGARAAGARSFVVNEGHGGNLFANVLPWELDSAAMLVRGFPKPLVMITGLDSTFGTLMFTGAHADAGSPGVMAHNFAFDRFAVNGARLNEVGINALMAGEMGVSVSLVSGDDALIDETRRMIGDDFVGIVTKRAVGRSAAITYSPARVRAMLTEAAGEAVRREMNGEIEPFTMERPYRVEFTLRSGYPAEWVDEIAGFEDFRLERVDDDRTFRFTTDSAREIGYLLDAIERVVIQ